jgi:hypothetical protein
MVLLGACRGPELIEGHLGSYRSLETVAETDRQGRLTLDIVPDEGENALLATAVPDDPRRLTLVQSFAIDGEVVYDSEAETPSDRRRTNAGFASETATLNWPITPDDLALAPGRRHVLELGLVDADLAYVQGMLDVQILLGTDPDLAEGTLVVDLVTYGVLADDATLTAATDAAVEVWKAIYADIGIALDIRPRVLTGEPLGPPTDPAMAEQWRALSASGPPDAVHLVLSPDDVAGPAGVVGVAGDIPGALVPSPRSGIRMLPERICGVDGACDPAEVQTYGELLAHEVGHYLGLFHPTEDTWDRWDAHTDTAECGSRTACEATLGTNVMFPYVVCRGADCPAQSDLTPQQVGSLHAYTGVD